MLQQLHLRVAWTSKVKVSNKRGGHFGGRLFALEEQALVGQFDFRVVVSSYC